MKLYVVYLLRNLTRNPLRTGLTCAAVALPIMIYVLSMAVVDGVDRFLDNSAKQLRLAVTQKSSIVNPLPAGYGAKIRSLDPTRTRIVSVCALEWIGGSIEGVQQPLSTIAADADTFVHTFPEYELTPAEIDAWHRDRQALIVGRDTAIQRGWKVGDRVTIMPSVPPFVPIEFHVISTAPHATDTVTNWFRRDYLDEIKKKEIGIDLGTVGFFFVKCASKADLDEFRVRIDDLFARSQDETKTQDEKSFMNEFIAQSFNLPRNLKILAAVTVFVAIMAAANTMSMSFRERINEVATLKALGFNGWLPFAQIQAESLLLCTLGGLVGAAGPFLAFTYSPLREYAVPIIQTLQVRPYVCAQALLISLMIGLVAAMLPAYRAWRMKVVNALRNLE